MRFSGVEPARHDALVAMTAFGLFLAVLFAAVFINSFTFTKAEASSVRLKSIERHLGLHERKHRKAIQRMLGVNPARTPWCGYAVAYAVKKAGQRPVRHYPSARAWLNFGKKISLRNARRGDVVVFRFKRGYHVALFKSHSKKGRIVACGGNMGNRFKCSIYRNRSIRGIRR